MRNLLIKLARRKCPHCKEYGISALSGIGKTYTYACTCSYCNKKFRVNSALAFLYKVGWPLGVGFTFLLIDTYVISIPESVSVLLIIPAMAGFVLLLRFLPMEEEK